MLSRMCMLATAVDILFMGASFLCAYMTEGWALLVCPLLCADPEDF